MDITFYDLELNKLHVLPASSKNVGYISMNCTIDFNGDGSFQLLFWDKELEALIAKHKEGLIIKYGDFEGFSTDYQFTRTEKRLYGMHLNGLLYKSVIPNTDGALAGNLETLVYEIINQYYSWLTTAETVGGFEDVTFWRNTYKQGNSYISDLVSRGHAGYKIYIDFQNKRFIFKLLKSGTNQLMLSENNLNAYEFQEDFDSKNAAYGGWYQQEQPDDADGNSVDPVWTYISSDSTKTGIYKQDVVLSAKTDSEARNELAEHVAVYTLSAKTRNIKYGEDYKLGDKVRVQKDGITVQKTVTSINIWHEGNEYNEQPILGELKEALSDNE